MFRDDALNIYVDGSSFSKPRRGGIGIRVVTVDNAGDPVPEDYPAVGYQGGAINEMELMACIEAIKIAMNHPVAKAHRRVQIITDSQYVSGNWQSALFYWPKQRWLGKHGQPIENAELWKEFGKWHRKAGLRIDIVWEPGKTNPDNKAVDKLAKASAEGALLKRPLKHVEVRRKLSAGSVQRGSVPMRGQELDIRVVTAAWLKLQGVNRYKYEVLGSSGACAGRIDIATSHELLGAGHHYRVTMGTSDRNPTIERLVSELPRIRRALNPHIPVMHEIRLSVTENVLRSRTLTEADYRKAIRAPGRGWVIDIEGQLVGFAVANGSTGNIWALFVRPDHERRGYGRQLHETMVSWLWSSGLQKLWLSTEPNTRAARFYEAAGWVKSVELESGEVRYELTRPSG